MSQETTDFEDGQVPESMSYVLKKRVGDVIQIEDGSKCILYRIIRDDVGYTLAIASVSMEHDNPRYDAAYERDLTDEEMLSRRYMQLSLSEKRAKEERDGCKLEVEDAINDGLLLRYGDQMIVPESFMKHTFDAARAAKDGIITTKQVSEYSTATVVTRYMFRTIVPKVAIALMAHYERIKDSYDQYKADKEAAVKAKK